MLKCKGAAGKGGGKSKVKGVGGENVSKTKQLQSSTSDYVVLLRQALYCDNGEDRNVLADLAPAFAKFDRNGLSCTIEFMSGKKLSRDTLSFVFNLTKRNMRDLYEDGGYGWDKDEKLEEMKDKSARYLLVKGEDGQLCGFVNFRFTLQGEVVQAMEGHPALYVYDIQLKESHRGKGLGKHLMQVLELAARKYSISYIMLPVTSADARGRNFFTTKLKGFVVDGEYSTDPTFEVLSKCIDSTLTPAPSTPSASSKTRSKTPNASTIAPATPLEKVVAVDPVKGAEPEESPVSALDFGLVSSPASVSSSPFSTASPGPSPLSAVPFPEASTLFPSHTSQDEGGPALDLPAPVGAAKALADTMQAIELLGITDEDQDNQAVRQKIVLQSPDMSPCKDLQATMERTAAEADMLGTSGLEQELSFEEPDPVPEGDLAVEDLPHTPEQHSTGHDDCEDIVDCDDVDADDQAEDVLEQLIEMFRENNGRDPTDDEVQQWMETIKSAMEDGLDIYN